MNWEMNRRVPLLAVVVLLLTDCGSSSISRNTFRLTPELLQERVLKTRKYEGISENDIISASAGVLQDLGFHIDESETELGVIVGSKKADATEIGQEVWWWAKLALTLGRTSEHTTDSSQNFRACIVIRPRLVGDDTTHYVRVTFQRIVWNTANRVSGRETLDAPEIYQKFFDRLSKSVFLEGRKI